MSDAGYLTSKREETIAKILDASVDFTDLLKSQKRILGIFSLGNFMERNDRKIFKAMLSILDDKVIGKNPSEEVKIAVDTALSFLENNDILGFDNYVAGVLELTIETPFAAFERQIFLSVLTMFNGLIGKAIQKAEVLIAKADAEA
jgi:hypothetical protein